MRRWSSTLALTLMVSSVLGAPRSVAMSTAMPVPLTYVDPGPGGFMSPNITYVGTIPVDSPGVSARVVKIGDQTRLYVSSAKDLSVYNVTDPAEPLLMGTLPIYNWENEDVAVSPDGKTVLLSDYTASFYLHVIHVEDLPGGLVAITPQGTVLSGNHTIECLDDTCNWAYGAEGKIFDLRDKTAPALAGHWSDVTSRGGHHVTRDATGLMWTDTTPIYALDPGSDPTHPTIVAKSSSTQMASKKTAYQHNNIRPYADQYRPRITEEDLADPNLRPGELLLGEGETNLTNGKCTSGSGPFVTYDLRNFDQPGASPFKPIDVFRPINGDYQNGDPAVTALGCSGHWFDISAENSTPDHIVTANGWYEHGTRLFDVDGKTGKITQIAFFQPVVGSASASYWIDANYVYTVDYERGIDILRYDPSKMLIPSRAQFRASWLAKLGVVDPIAASERYLCRLAATGRAPRR